MEPVERRQHARHTTTACLAIAGALVAILNLVLGGDLEESQVFNSDIILFGMAAFIFVAVLAFWESAGWQESF